MIACVLAPSGQACGATLRQRWGRLAILVTPPLPVRGETSRILARCTTGLERVPPCPAHGAAVGARVLRAGVARVLRTVIQVRLLVTTPRSWRFGMSAATALKQVPLFQHLDEHALQRLARRARRLTLDSGTIVLREGDASDSLYVILTGRVRVSREAAPGQVIELEVLGAGSFFGELALLDSGPRSATVATMTACTVLVIDKRLFATLMHEAPPEVGGTHACRPESQAARQS